MAAHLVFLHFDLVLHFVWFVFFMQLVFFVLVLFVLFTVAVVGVACTRLQWSECEYHNANG